MAATNLPLDRLDLNADGKSLRFDAFGKRYDLPVPLWLFVFCGAAVVFLSFLLVLPRAVAEAGVPMPKLYRPLST